MSNTLCLPCTGRNADLAERILNFLIEPVDDGPRKSAKRAPKRASKKVRTISKGSANVADEVTEHKTSVTSISTSFPAEDDRFSLKKNEDDYVYRPGKSPSTKRSASQSRKKHKRSLFLCSSLAPSRSHRIFQVTPQCRKLMERKKETNKLRHLRMFLITKIITKRS